MKALNLKCIQCGKEYPLEAHLKCTCGGILEVIYDYTDCRLPKNPKGTWDYIDFLPIKDKANVVSLGEGWTPLVHVNRLGEKLHLNNLYVKDETKNPSGSFKDRPNTVAISKAKELGKDTIVIASSGNASASASAYAAKAGLRCIIFVPEHAPAEKLAQAKAHGAHIFKVKGDYSNAFNLALEATNKYGWYNVTSTYLNPYSVEGDKVVAYELYEQLGVPDYILVPIGAGPLLHGIFKGFKELKSAGLIHKLPKMVGVQTSSCSPIVDAFEQRAKSVKACAQPGKTIASGIDDPLKGYEEDGTLTLSVIYESDGYGVKVDDENNLEGLYLLAQMEGVFAEPAGAIGVAGARQMLAKNVISKDDCVVLMVTGHGLKNTKAIDIQNMDIVGNVDEVKTVLEKVRR